MRAILLLPLLLGGLGCDGAAPEELASQICGEGVPSVDAEVYRALTASSWFDRGQCESTDPLPPTCNRVRLAGNGTFTWTAVSDAPERNEAGMWNFRARDATSGLVCLDNGSVVDFALTPAGGLRWGPLGELAGEDRLEPGPGRDALPTISVAPLFVDLTAHAWAKTDEMDLYRLPTTLTLRGDGTFDAELRNGECTASGTFSLIRERTFRSDRFTLWSDTAPNTCDLRGGTPFALPGGDTPRFIEDGLLHLADALYRDARTSTERRIVEFSAYGDQAGLTVHASWDGALRAGEATFWLVSLHNNGATTQAVSSLRIDLTPLTLTTDGFVAAGPAAIAVDRALGLTISPFDAAGIDDEVVFTPGPAGWVSLHIEIDSADAQSYRNEAHFLVELP
jgi:hypothetical protein